MALLASKHKASVRQRQTVVAIFPDTKEGRKAFEALSKAAAELKHTDLERMAFERLDFGETAILDQFYNATVVVTDVTDKSYQATLFYHLGLRESFDMKHNIVTCVDEHSAYKAGRRGSVNPTGTTLPPLPGVRLVLLLLCHSQTFYVTYKALW